MITFFIILLLMPCGPLDESNINMEGIINKFFKCLVEDMNSRRTSRCYVCLVHAKTVLKLTPILAVWRRAFSDMVSCLSTISWWGGEEFIWRRSGGRWRRAKPFRAHRTQHHNETSRHQEKIKNACQIGCGIWQWSIYTKVSPRGICFVEVLVRPKRLCALLICRI